MSLPSPINWIRSSDYFAEVKLPEFIWNLMVPNEVIDGYYGDIIPYYPDTENAFDSVWAQFAFKVSKSQILEYKNSGATEQELILNFTPDAIEKYGLPDNKRIDYGEGYRYSLPAPQQKSNDYNDMNSYLDFINQEVRPNILLQLGIPDVSFREIIYRVQFVVKCENYQYNEEYGGVQARLERAYNADTLSSIKLK